MNTNLVSLGASLIVVAILVLAEGLHRVFGDRAVRPVVLSYAWLVAGVILVIGLAVIFALEPVLL